MMLVLKFLRGLGWQCNVMMACTVEIVQWPDLVMVVYKCRCAELGNRLGDGCVQCRYQVWS